MKIPDLNQYICELSKKNGSRKPMGKPSGSPSEAHYFLLRKFTSVLDFLIIFNTKRCRRNCHFCALPFKSGPKLISSDDIASQFACASEEIKPAIDVIERLTMSNEGSILDEMTFPRDALFRILSSYRYFPSAKECLLETRLEFVDEEVMKQCKKCVGESISLCILTGVETISPNIRESVLNKREPIELIEEKFELLGREAINVCAYILYKPDPTMTDVEAYDEAKATVEYVKSLAIRSGITAAFRINPMYVAEGTPWSKKLDREQYRPPKLTDIARLSNSIRKSGHASYIGLTSEGLSDITLTYRARSDFSKDLYRQCILHNLESDRLVKL